MNIAAGTLLLVTTASGEQIQMRAIGSPVRGRDFPVVWVCSEDQYVEPGPGSPEPDGIPWPLDAVEVVRHAKV